MTVMSGVELRTFVARVVSDGIEAARRDYASSPDKLRGAVAGFNACLDKDVEGLRLLLEDARREAHEARLSAAPDYWEKRCFEAEVEWTCNCVTAALVCGAAYVRDEVRLVDPTARGLMKAAEILGVSPAPAC